MSSRTGINGTSILIVLVGSVLAYSGLKGKRFSVVARDLLAGQNPQASATDAGLSINTGGGGSGSVPSAGFTAPSAGPAANATAAANQALGKTLAAPFGWSFGNEWNALVSLWDRESGWRNTADTRVTHAGGDGPGSTVFAYGVAQARPATKYPLPGRPPDLGGIADPTTQILWGLSYIKSNYGSPSAALAHENANGWY